MPRILFGAGTFDELQRLVRDFGTTVLLVTGSKSYRSSEKWERLLGALKDSVSYFHVRVEGEPSPTLVDRVVEEFSDKNIDVVVAWGGGSVIDGGKAISAMLTQDGSVLDYLEGVGTGAVHSGEKVPFIAVPTTSGTGSEATKNAVLSQIGSDGFKKSLRHDNFVPDIVVLDPRLMLSCPPGVTAACGMDAFTQLLESYVATKASPLTDALALSGLECIARCLVPACTDGANDVDIRGGMAYAALMSGITLANAGLGVVHGLASPIGGYFDIPHGVVCGTLIGEATAATVEKLMQQHGPKHSALRKYARVGAILAGRDEDDVAKDCELLLRKVEEWTETLKIPRLGKYGIQEEDFEKIVAGTGNKNNPVPLEPEEIMEILKKRL
jgi:alcohol dehydrogenase class IV